MPMPETSVYENYLTTAREDQIRCPRQLPSMQSVSIAKAVNELAHGDFWLRIL
jgi:hypothetical protein